MQQQANRNATYSQSTGDLRIDGAHAGRGYSGTGDGRNNPAMQHVPHVGPIPRGKYSVGLAFAHGLKGPLCMRLSPIGHDCCGRSGFLVHGDNATHDASEGCIILARPLRLRVSQEVTLLEVVE